MILIDANLLLYAYNRASASHDRARDWLEEVLTSGRAVLLPWTVILAFLRISTDSRVWPRPFTIEEASRVASDLLSAPNVVTAQQGDKHWSILNDLLSSARCRGPLVMDAHLAAIAIEHGATLCTCDRDFTRFPGLKVSYPLD